MLITYNYIADKIYHPVLNRINLYFLYLKKIFFSIKKKKIQKYMRENLI